MPTVSLITLLAAMTAQSLVAANPNIGIYLTFDSTPAELPLQVMAHEVELLMQPSGVSLDWRLASLNRGDEPFAGVVLIRFKGACRVGANLDAANDFGSLGETRTLASAKVVKGRVLPYGEVQCDEVRRAADQLRPGSTRDERERALGVALARVVAHELYHILGATTAHSHEGLAKPSHSLRDLASPGPFGFSERDSRTIREHVERF